MRIKYLSRLISALLAAVMLLQLCGCTSVLVETIRMADLEEEQSGDNEWSFDSYSTEVVNSYPAGKDAFYIDQSKCVKSEIEEFHLLACDGSRTMYFFNAPTAPSYKGKDRNSGYYCLAVYNYETKEYTALEEGFYNKNNSVSMAADTDSTGTSFACIGNTYMLISDMKIQKKFTLDNDEKKKIQKKVGKDYICIDIAIIDPFQYRIAAAYMDVSELDEDSEEEPKCAIFDITFDASEDADHDIDHEHDDLDSSLGSICSSYVDYVSTYSGDVYYYHESDGKDYIKLETHAPYREISGKDNFKLKGKKKSEDLLAFSVQSFDEQNSYILTLFSDRLELWQVTETEKTTSVDLNYVYKSRFSIDDSRSYISLDDMPSIVMISKDKLYACSLTKGFRLIGSKASNTQSRTVARGAYYAAYSEDDINYTLIGFNSELHDCVNITYRDGKEISRKVTKTEYTMSDLPYAKIYNAYVGI